MYRIPPNQFALIRNGMGGLVVSFSGLLVLPVLHRAELLNLGIRKIRLARNEGDSLSCRDGIRADVVMEFHVIIVPTHEAVLEVYRRLGCRFADDPDEVAGLFENRFLQVMKQCARGRSCEEMVSDPEAFRDAVPALRRSAWPWRQSLALVVGYRGKKKRTTPSGNDK